MVEFQGQTVSYERARYLLAQRNQSTLARVNALAMQNARTVFLTGAELDRQTFGGFVRRVLPPIVDQWGKVNAVAAMDHYDASRELWYQVHGEKAPGGQAYARSTRYASAITSGRIYKATIPNFDSVALANPVVNEMMKTFATNGFDASSSAGQNAITRTIAQYNRDTMLFNSGLDESVKRVQRVAEFNACGFCKSLAVGGYGRTSTRTSDYAVKWHNHCRCSIEVLFDGDKEVRPEYYDQIERDLRRARETVGNRQLDVSRELDRLAQRRTRLPATTSAPRIAPATPPAPVVGPYQASQWFWSDKFQGDATAKAANQKLAIDTPLADAALLPKLDAPDTLEQALKNTNPLYAVSFRPGYTENCARVVNAFELRRRGLNVTASAHNLRDRSQVVSQFIGAVWKKPDGESIFNFFDQSTIVKNSVNAEARLQQRMSKMYPDGARGMLNFDWRNTRGAGHVINWEKVDGQIVFVDAQTGKKGAELSHYFPKSKNHQWHRLDDAEPTAIILRYIEEPS